MNRPDLSAATWIKSSYSDDDGGNCIEIAPGFPAIVPVLMLGRSAWTAFTSTCPTGRYASRVRIGFATLHTSASGGYRGSPVAAQVTINEGVLWVGGEAYPLRNISHVGQRELAVDKGAAWKKFILRTIGWLIVGGIFASVAGTPGTIVFLAVEAFLVWKLVSVLQKPPVYGLVLNTSGTQREAIWSTVQEEIQQLVYEITKAIGNPDVAQTINVNVAHAVQNGDVIHQYGAGSIGKAQHSGSGSIG